MPLPLGWKAGVERVRERPVEALRLGPHHSWPTLDTLCCRSHCHSYQEGDRYTSSSHLTRLSKRTPLTHLLHRTTVVFLPHTDFHSHTGTSFRDRYRKSYTANATNLVQTNGPSVRGPGIEVIHTWSLVL